MPRQYHRGEKPHEILTKYGKDKLNRYFYLKVGEVLEIDYKLYRAKIRWLQDAGSPNWIPISFAYCGPAGCMGGLPEEHSIVICGYYNEGHGKGSPLIISYLPAALSVGVEYNRLKFMPDQISNEDINEIDYKFRNLSEGDMIMASSLGGQILVNNSTEISDENQDSIWLRSGDQSIISTSLNNFIFADGASVSAGIAIRNNMNIFNPDGSRIPNINARETTLSDGRMIIYIVPFGDRIEYDTQYYTEYRVDVDEKGDGFLDSNEINSSSPLSTRDPIVTMAMGNYIGADDKSNKYGTILRPVLFSSLSDKAGSFDLIQCAQNKGVDEVSNLGLAYALHFLKSGAFMGVDKEGHYYINLPASISNPLGSGRSMSILAQGNLKEIWGSAGKDGNSWDLTTKGGIKWDVGTHGPIEKTRSMDIRTDSGAYIEIGGEDDDGFAKTERIFGNVSSEINGDKTDRVSGTESRTIGGGKDDHIMGSASYRIDVDNTINVLGVFTETVIKEKQCRIGQRKTTITSGNDELTVIGGDIQETIKTFGNRKTDILVTGNIEENITTGNRKTSVKLGNYEVKVTTGGIDIKTSVGTVSISGTTVDVKGQVTLNLTAPVVNIGQGPRGGVVTGVPGVPSHFDYTTGSPLKGALTVKAGA